MAEWKQIRLENGRSVAGLAKANPGIGEALQKLNAAAASKNALDDKTRELIALAVAATTRCEGCIAAHAEKAVKAGATRDELAETLAMAVALNAGAAVVYSSRILEAFDQFSG